MTRANWFENLDKTDLVIALAEHFGDLNMIHPFREGNGRAQRILFEHIIANAGYETNWWAVEEAEWIKSNIDAVLCDYSGLASIFSRCVGATLILD
ncbi:hypothetical protein GCM10017655_12170 [Pseudomonas turukhanskensis]|uniref:protein adenylyltransferase n=2 Tax=Pseudomonas turukhanskensis TaxID=1806536 RepID=A0A9W6K253_9PSED|nr:hypothetical protein GCM10017655_12170 [Pseudomonas turukhanskensis]